MDAPKLKFRNITVSGSVATGTSTLAKSLAETLGWKRINAGDIQREYDRARGMSEHFSGSDTRSDEHEQAIEAMTKQKLIEENNLVYEVLRVRYVAARDEYAFACFFCS